MPVVVSWNFMFDSRCDGSAVIRPNVTVTVLAINVRVFGFWEAFIHVVICIDGRARFGIKVHVSGLPGTLEIPSVWISRSVLIRPNRCCSSPHFELVYYQTAIQV